MQNQKTSNVETYHFLHFGVSDGAELAALDICLSYRLFNLASFYLRLSDGCFPTDLSKTPILELWRKDKIQIQYYYHEQSVIVSHVKCQMRAASHIFFSTKYQEIKF